MRSRFESQVSAWYGGGSWGPEQEGEWQKFKRDREKREKEAPPEEPPKKPQARRFAHALVIGRFDPVHRGHAFLVDTARGLADATSVVVRTTARDAIDGATRVAWCRELFGAAHALEVPPPAVPASEPAFWQYWAHAIRPIAPDADVLVAADREAWRLADALGIAFVLVDPDRLAVPISATQIRANPLATWRHLPPPVRAHYAVRVAILGPEVSGKSTLAAALADRLSTVCVPEQARVVAQRRGGMLREVDMQVLVAAQRACEDALARQAHRVLVCDTNTQSLALWSERLFGKTMTGDGRADLYVLPELLPFGDEPARAEFATRCKVLAMASGAPWLEVRGSVDARVAQVIAAIAARWPDAIDVVDLSASAR